MLTLLKFRQGKSSCGPASLKIVLQFFGIKKSEKSLVELTGCTKEKGASGKAILKAAKSLGFKGFIKDSAKIKDIRKYVLERKIPVIVDWFSKDDGHYSVVAHIDKENIYLLDPEFGEIRPIKIDTFKRVWFDFPGDYLKRKSDLILRRIIFVYR